ncbi:Calcium/calmodulin-regulated receptor-like kinase 2 [Orobanche gracilis]
MARLSGEDKKLSWDERLQIALDISHGIEYLHEGAVPPVIHRDLKCANILLDHSMGAKVADFGLSNEEVFDGRNSGLKCTYVYMDPAYISTSKLTMMSDIYSFGIIIFELITAIHPHQNLLEYVGLAAMDHGRHSGSYEPKRWSSSVDVAFCPDRVRGGPTRGTLFA